MDEQRLREVPESSLSTAYEAVNQHWTHAEQERWSLLYNFLMASTILLLAWAAVFAAMPSSLRAVVLVVLAAAGGIVSLLWITIGCRVNMFIRTYGELGAELEARIGIDSVGPFQTGERIRTEGKNNPKSGGLMDRWGRQIPSARFVVLIPTLFAVVYAVLLIVSLV